MKMTSVERVNLTDLVRNRNSLLFLKQESGLERMEKCSLQWEVGNKREQWMDSVSMLST
jgi:hypothetical protein